MKARTAPRLFRRGARWVGHQRWIRFGLRYYLARFVHNPGQAPPEEFSVPFYGLRYVGDFASFIDWNVYYFGAYSAAELDLLGRILAVRGGGCCLDVGANVGNHTLFLASRAAFVIAIEPVAALADQLRARVSGNGLRNVEVIQCGLGESAAELPFFASSGHNQGTGTFAGGATNALAEIISVRPGDELLAERGDPPVVLAKIDVEGFEPDVLSGLRKTLDRSRPIVFFEWSPKSAQRAGTADPGAFLPSGYSLYRFEPQVVWLWAFSRAPFSVQPWLPGTETNVDTNLLAVPAEHLKLLRAVLGIPAVHEV